MKWLILDIDGTLTDGGLNYSASGQEFQRFHVIDGTFLKELQELGYSVKIFSGRTTKLAEKRYEKFSGIEYFENVKSKSFLLDELMQRLSVNPFTVAVGDDLNDLELFEKCHLTFAVKNSVEELKNVASFTLNRNGGDGVLYDVWKILKNYNYKI